MDVHHAERKFIARDPLRRESVSNLTLFYFIGKFSELPYEIKSPTGRDAHDALAEIVTEVTARQR